MHRNWTELQQQEYTFGNFMSFPAEIIRTTTNIAEQGLKEMKHLSKAGERIIGSNVSICND